VGQQEAQSNELLVVRCQLGERDAFADLVRAWHGAIERYVGRMLNGPDADVEPALIVVVLTLGVLAVANLLTARRARSALLHRRSQLAP
jgi:hypothetical protein